MIHAKMADLCSVFTRITKMLTLFSDAKSHLAYEHTCGVSCYLVLFFTFLFLFIFYFSYYFLSVSLFIPATFSLWVRYVTWKTMLGLQYGPENEMGPTKNT